MALVIADTNDEKMSMPDKIMQTVKNRSYSFAGTTSMDAGVNLTTGKG